MLCLLASCYPLKSKLLSHKNIKSQDQKKFFSRGSVGMTVNGIIPLSIIWLFTDFGSWIWEKLNYILYANSKHILPSGEPFPSLKVCCHLIGVITLSSKGHSIFLSTQLFQNVNNKVRPVDSMIMGPL